MASDDLKHPRKSERRERLLVKVITTAFALFLIGALLWIGWRMLTEPGYGDAG